MTRFDGRVAIVTGAARGIGAATARRLAGEGATVAILDLAKDGAEEVAAEIAKAGGTAGAYRCDVTDAEAVNDVVDEVVRDHGRLDILVNNAGITRDNLLFKMTDEDWYTALTVNLTSAFLMSRAAQKHMVPARYGKIVSLSSVSALGNRGQVNYSAAKAGIQGLTATLAIELGPYNINVNAVAPGFVVTAMTDETARRMGITPEELRAAAAAAAPLGRPSDPADIAAAIAFLASDDARQITGQTLYVNGGAR